jgi:hypothetical protein
VWLLTWLPHIKPTQGDWPPSWTTLQNRISFCIILTINSSYWSKEHWLISFCGEGLVLSVKQELNTLWEHPHKCKTALSAQYSGSRSPHRCNKFFMPANRRRAAQRRPGIKGDISSQKLCIPVFRIQRSVSRFNVLWASTIGSRASSATRPVSSIYSSHPAECAAVSTSTHCSAPQSRPRLPTVQPAPCNRLTLYTTWLSLHCFSESVSSRE